ncbi:ester cyclase [Nostoc sp. CCY0012]|uniref:ester cyclase n=1 Tax=Nostoc sp. CCY0012 TaxID=1056123 RepID=UPI0039C707DD
MTVSENKAIAQQFCEQIWGKGYLAAVDEFTSNDFQAYYSIFPQALDREALKAWFGDIHTAFSDLEFKITDIIGEADKVVISWTVQGVNAGRITFLNLPPTMKLIKWTGMTIYRLSEGKIVEEKGEEDALSVMQQLGLIKNSP